MMNRILLINLFIFSVLAVFAQTKKHTISGYVEDGLTGEKIIGATVSVPGKGVGTSTNTFGFYSLTLPEDSVYLAISYFGFETKYFQLLLDKDLELNIALGENEEIIKGVEIVAKANRKIEDEVQMSQIEVPIQQIKKLPALLGEVDVLKVLQLLPGVQSGGEGTSGLYVRGGSPDQNLILLDGVPVYNASHLFGFFSVFNADAIKSVTLTKGGYPARYGGRLSSVLEINMKEGNNKEFHGEGSIGLISSKLTLEGPIWKGKTSFIVSARRTYADIVAKPFIKRAQRGEETQIDPAYYFYDINAKVNHTFNNKHRLFFSVYAGQDVFNTKVTEDYDDEGSFSLKSGLDWGNVTSALRWNYMWNNKLFSNVTATYSRYQFNILIDQEDRFRNDDGELERQAFRIQYLSNIRDWAGKIDFDYVPNPNHYLRFGASAIHHTFSPGALQFNISGEEAFSDTTIGNRSRNSGEFATYIEDDFKIGKNFKANIGVHASGFLIEKKFYGSVQPRLGTRYLLPKGVALKASFASMAQYVHLLTNEGIGLPTDLWVPTTRSVKPQTSWQVAAGFAKTFGKDYEISIEGYYKNMNNLVSYSEGADFFSVGDDWESKIEQGKGKSYGAEFFVQKRTGKFTGWAGYTLSWSTRTFENINSGRTYPFKYDRRHDMSLVAIYDFNDRISLTGAWVYGTGNSVTLPIERYRGFTPSIDNHTFNGTGITTPSSKNAYRMNAYHRLDISLSITKKKKRWERSFVIGTYNTYNRKNPFFIYNGNDDDGNPAYKQVSLFPILPALSFNFKW